jgi:hypothetical protein
MMRGSHALAGLVGLAAMFGVASRGAAEVNVNINIGAPPLPPPPIVIAEPPPMIVVPRTDVYYAPSVAYDFFYYGGHYYTFHEGGWFWSASVHGPWWSVHLGSVPRPVLAVPIAYYKARPVAWRGCKHHGPPPWAPAHGYRRKHGHGNGNGHGHDD